MNKNNKDIGVRNGDIWMLNRMGGEGTAIHGGHPSVIISNEISCIRSSNITVVPITTKEPSQPTHILIPANDETGLQHTSISMAESITTVSKNAISFKIGFLNDEIMSNVKHSILLHTAIIRPINKAHINDLCEQISGNIKYLDNQITRDISSKLAISSLNICIRSLQYYSERYNVNWNSILLSNLKKNNVELTIDEIEKIYNVNDI